MDRVIKSVVWLTACGALGYSLLLVTSAGKTELHQKLSKTNSDEVTRKTQIVETLRRATENKAPMYIQTKREIEETVAQNRK